MIMKFLLKALEMSTIKLVISGLICIVVYVLLTLGFTAAILTSGIILLLSGIMLFLIKN